MFHAGELLTVQLHIVVGQQLDEQVAQTLNVIFSKIFEGLSKSSYNDENGLLLLLFTEQKDQQEKNKVLPNQNDASLLDFQHSATAPWCFRVSVCIHLMPNRSNRFWDRYSTYNFQHASLQSGVLTFVEGGMLEIIGGVLIPKSV